MKETTAHSQSDVDVASEFHGDRPIGPSDFDELGFAPIATRIAEAIVSQSADGGLVMAIEGRWGSGKSSLLNLVDHSLSGFEGEERNKVIRFEPWLVGDRDALLEQLFEDIAYAIDEFETELNPNRTDVVEGAISLADKMRAYSAKLRGPSKIIGVLGSLGVPGAQIAADVIDKVAAAAETVSPRQSIVRRKTEIASALSEVPYRLVVIIDDLDRLEPAEASEVIRLVRAVADFPNIVYVLSFDPDVLTRSVEGTLNLASGRDYLEKIIQVSVSVPLPESFDLRRWFSRELARLANIDEEVATRLKMVIDSEGGRRLNTPRDVVRVLNSIRMLWPGLQGRVDFADFVWLQLVRASNPHLYRWIENYLREMAALHDGALISEYERRQLFSDLEKYLLLDRINYEDIQYFLSDMLPGMSWHSAINQDDDKPPIAMHIDDNTVQEFVQAHRLASPFHYRLYFSLAFPAGALTDEECTMFLDRVSQSRTNAIQAFSKLVESKRPQGGTKADLAIERLLGTASASISAKLASNLVFALADGLDDMALASARADWGEINVWRAATRLLHQLIRVVPSKSRSQTIRNMFQKGRAIGWLTRVLRDEIFDHGIYGDKAKLVEDRIFTAEQFEIVKKAMLHRYKNEPVETMLAVPTFLNVLYAWGQSGEPEEAKAWVKKATMSDEGLLSTLDSMRSWRAVNGEVQFPLTKDNVGRFFDFDAVQDRVNEILNNSESTKSMKEKAESVLEALSYNDN